MKLLVLLGILAALVLVRILVHRYAWSVRQRRRGEGGRKR